jgi:murein DD-endopeptidase MepM/ murein hydrolase activator NlpD
VPAPQPVAAALLLAVTVPLVYRPPVDAPVADRFRPPPTAYGAGNRGLEYFTNPGEPIRAAAGGQVSFAGRVGASLHVSVVHPDGLRTTYSYLRSIRVQRGERVEAGHVLGEAGERFHLGARVGSAYLDPEVLFADALRRGGRARLVPDEDPSPSPDAPARLHSKPVPNH